MERVRIRFFAILLCSCLVSAAALTKIAAAQCMPDSPPESATQRPDCDNSNRGAGGAAGELLVARVPLRVFVHNPLGATMSWMVVRSQPSRLRYDAVEPNRQRVGMLRGGPKR